jgi:anti-sigma factor RsiW
MLTCRDCQSHLTAYLHGEVTPKMRRQIAQHLRQCPQCDALYASQRDLSQELAFALPRLGQPDAGQLQRIWGAVQAEQNHPSGTSWRHYAAQYGFAALLLMLALLIPWTLHSQQMALALPLPPVPQEAQVAVSTPPSHVAVVAQALPTHPGQTSEVRFAPVSSPAIAPSPSFQPLGSLAPAVTDTP